MKTHLGIYSDWVEAAHRQAGLYPVASPGGETQRRIQAVLGFNGISPITESVHLEETWKRGWTCR